MLSRFPYDSSPCDSWRLAWADRLWRLSRLIPSDRGGETVLDYSVYDARRAGFGKVVFVIRRALEAVPGAHRDARIRNPASRVQLCVSGNYFRLPGKPARAGRSGRTLGGTGTRLVCAANAVNSPFATINAVRSYGGGGIPELADFLSRPIPAGESRAGLHAVGFSLVNTLSEHGCRISGAFARSMPGAGAGG